jgi:hypothetical protein
MKPITQYSQPQVVEDIIAAVQKLLPKGAKLSVRRPDYTRTIGTMDNLFLTSVALLNDDGHPEIRWVKISNQQDQDGTLPVSFIKSSYTEWVAEDQSKFMRDTGVIMRSRWYLHELALSTITEPCFKVGKRDSALLPQDIVTYLTKAEDNLPA